MARTPSVMSALGTIAPDFVLPDPNGRVTRLNDFRGSKALLVAFICNHCPFVVNLKQAFVDFANDMMPQGLAIVAINPNDAREYPADGPEEMLKDIARFGYPFPYLIDADQQVAKNYQAACTPDFFLFDSESKLVYRGQFDASRPGNGIAPTGRDLRSAVDAVLSGAPVLGDQYASLGCNIKWRPGNEPEFVTHPSLV